VVPATWTPSPSPTQRPNDTPGFSVADAVTAGGHEDLHFTARPVSRSEHPGRGRRLSGVKTASRIFADGHSGRFYGHGAAADRPADGCGAARVDRRRRCPFRERR